MTELDAEEYLEHQRRILRRAGFTAKPALPADCSALIGGRRMHYLDWGGSGRQVLFLHGTAMNAHAWDLICLGLRERFRCIAPDLRGHGDSEWSASMSYGVGAHIGDLAAFIDSLELDQPVLVGFSLGGNVALGYAIDYPERPAGVIAIESVLSSTVPMGQERLRAAIDDDDELDSPEEFVERALQRRPSAHIDQLRFTMRSNLMQLPNGRWSWKYDRRHRRRDDLQELFRQERGAYARRVADIQCPVLLVHGEKSDIVSRKAFESFAASMSTLLEAVEVEGMGHSIHGRNPAFSLSLIERFVENVAVQDRTR